MPPKKKAATGRPVAVGSTAAAKPVPSKEVGVYLTSQELANLWPSPANPQPSPRSQTTRQSASARDRSRPPRPIMKTRGGTMFVPWNALSLVLLTLAQGFSALLEPFYGGKSLTDPINTAEVWYRSSSSLDGHSHIIRTNGTSCQHSLRSKGWSSSISTRTTSSLIMK